MAYKLCADLEASSTDGVNDEYFAALPVGYRFLPTDQELIIHYLRNKILNRPLPANRFQSLDLYSYTPQQLAETYKLLKETAWYFFTPRNKKYLNGSRPNRGIGNGNGFWKATGSDILIQEDNGFAIGHKKILVFFEKKPNGQKVKTNWIMHEYMLAKKRNTPSTGAVRAPGDMKLDDWVLCKVYKNYRSKNEVEENNEEVDIITSIEEVPNPNQNHMQSMHNDMAVGNGMEEVPTGTQHSQLALNQQFNNPPPRDVICNDMAAAGYGMPNFAYSQSMQVNRYNAADVVMRNFMAENGHWAPDYAYSQLLPNTVDMRYPTSLSSEPLQNMAAGCCVANCATCIGLPMNNVANPDASFSNSSNGGGIDQVDQIAGDDYLVLDNNE